MAAAFLLLPICAALGKGFPDFSNFGCKVRHSQLATLTNFIYTVRIECMVEWRCLLLAN
jgi:hypothetical protein